jgi:hypothetical protein
MRILSLLFTLPLCLPAAAMPGLPDWQELEFEQRALWLTARSSIRLSPGDGGTDTAWNLSVSSSVGTSEESVQISFDPGSGATLEHDRYSRGKNKRFKRHIFDRVENEKPTITRERYEPGPEASPNPTEGWTLTSRRSLPYPALPGDEQLASAYTLLVLAERTLALPGRSLQVYVHTDLNTYVVDLQAVAEESITVDYQVAGGQQTRQRKADVIMVRVHPEPWGKLADKPDFNFMGLTGEITILLDKQTRMPLELRGSAPRIGRTAIKLKSAILRDTPA